MTDTSKLTALSSNQRDIQVAAVMEAQKRWPALRDSTEARERSAFMAGVTFVLTQSSHTTPETSEYQRGLYDGIERGRSAAASNARAVLRPVGFDPEPGLFDKPSPVKGGERLEPLGSQYDGAKSMGPGK